MAPATTTEEQALAKQAQEVLEGTPYACSELSALGGGTANFLYRGILRQPSPDTTSTSTSSSPGTVIVKLSTDYVAINRAFPLDVTRCFAEKSMLEALDGFPRRVSTGVGDAHLHHVIVKAPRLYHFDPVAHIQVLEDFHDTKDLTTVLVSPDVAAILPGPRATSVGRAVGAWLRGFHGWSSEVAQADLVRRVGSNAGMRRLKCLITYDSFLEILDRHPETVEGHRETLEKVRKTMQYEFERPPVADQPNCGLIHGDFWGGNVLLPSNAQGDITALNELFIIDWENVQFGHRAVDIGGFLGDLYERFHFKGVEESLPAMEGFIAGYGPVSEDLAYAIAIHAGVHLICWYYRRDRNAPLPYLLPIVLKALTIGRDLMLMGWARDRKGLQSSILGSMFEDGNLL
ncbi:kinase-like domain-containing protein [Astrocystis sublimbata]|nr:kinase-like domain-containing protein [Astrocystis sublimbata]